MDRILLIEDDAGAQLLFKNRLQELGYEVVVAATGARGLMEARAGRFDLFLVDVELGSGIDGYEVTRRLKGMPPIHGVPVVLISGQVKSQEDLHRGYEAGCEAFLVKGDLTLMEDVVRAMLRIKSLQDDLGLQNRLLEEQNRRLSEERERGADLEVALRDAGSRGVVFRELASGRPDGLLVVDAEGVVRWSDRGAQDILGQEIDGGQLGLLTPGTGLEAFVRNARSEPHEAFRFDLADPVQGGVRSLSASVVPTVPRATGSEPPLRVVLLFDAVKRRVAAEMLRLEEQGIPRRELGPLLEAARRVFHPGALVGESEAAHEIRARVAEAAASDLPVLLRGESGTGKSFAARAIHFARPAGGAFIPADCGALAPALLESELFGHTKGAFPAAITDRPGLLLQAQHGTVFLERVEELPLALQEKLLEVLERGRLWRVGATRPEPVRVRVIAASEAELTGRVDRGAFLGELLRRLSSIEIYLPALRERGRDAPLLARHFVQRFGAAKDLRLSEEALWLVGRYGWPGNVRELESAIEQACAAAPGPEIDPLHFPQPLQDLLLRGEQEEIPPALPRGRPRVATLSEALAEEALADEPPSLELYERKAILHALRETGGDKLAAARLLGIGKSTFYRKLKTHGLS